MENFLTAAKLHTHAKRFMDAYSAAMQPLSREFAIPQTAAEILLFLANNPENSTAKEICAMRHLKPGIVSLHVDTLATLWSEKAFPETGESSALCRPRRQGPSSPGAGPCRRRLQRRSRRD